MKWIPGNQTLELTQRNIAALTDKLDDPLSACTLGAPGGEVQVRAVEDAEPAVRAAMRLAAGAESPPVVLVSRGELSELATVGATVTVGAVTVVSVADEAHYADRLPGIVFMPSSGESY